VLVAVGPPAALAACNAGRSGDVADGGAEGVPPGTGPGADAASELPGADGGTSDASLDADDGACRVPDAGYPVLREPYYPLPCGLAASSYRYSVPIACEALDAGGQVSHDRCRDLCIDAGAPEPGPFRPAPSYCSVMLDDAGALVLACYDCNGGGRRPEGWTARPQPARSVLGSYFASAARLEAASVPAFERLRAELASLGAPTSLVERAEAAAADERLHAATTTALARRFGAEVEPVLVPAHEARSLLDVARENAVEGCVRETFGALVAIYQAERSSDPEIRSALVDIARDESRHAELAWDVASFCGEGLAADDVEAIEASMQEALATLRAEIEGAVDADLRRLAGLPGRDDALRLFELVEGVVRGGAHSSSATTKNASFST